MGKCLRRNFNRQWAKPAAQSAIRNGQMPAAQFPTSVLPTSDFGNVRPSLHPKSSNLQILKSSNPRILKSSIPQILASSHPSPQTLKSSYLVFFN
jgi:hypothetical protein